MTPKEKYVPVWVSREMRNLAKSNAALEGKRLKDWLGEAIKREYDTKHGGKKPNESFW